MKTSEETKYIEKKSLVSIIFFRYEANLLLGEFHWGCFGVFIVYCV